MAVVKTTKTEGLNKAYLYRVEVTPVVNGKEDPHLAFQVKAAHVAVSWNAGSGKSAAEVKMLLAAPPKELVDMSNALSRKGDNNAYIFRVKSLDRGHNETGRGISLFLSSEYIENIRHAVEYSADYSGLLYEQLSFLVNTNATPFTAADATAVIDGEDIAKAMVDYCHEKYRPGDAQRLIPEDEKAAARELLSAMYEKYPAIRELCRLERQREG